MLRTGFSLAIFQDFRITHPQMIARTSRAVDMKIKTVSGILSANCLNQLSPTTREAITPKRIAGKAVIKTSLDKRRKIFGAVAPFILIMMQVDYDRNFDRGIKDVDRIFRVEVAYESGTKQAIINRPLAEAFIRSSPHTQEIHASIAP